MFLRANKNPNSERCSGTRFASDVLGKTMFYDTGCDNATASRKDVLRTFLSDEDPVKVIFMKRNNEVQTKSTEAQTSEGFIGEIDKSCLTWQTTGGAFDSRIALMATVETLREYERWEPKAYLTIVGDKMSLLKSNNVLWKIRFDNKRIYLKNFLSGYLPNN